MSRKEESVITGYYRYTDIWFDWHKSLPEPEDRDAIKAILAHDALTHLDHPLHPGKKGVDMFLGTFHSGESRLMFSSKQVDYVRYWLHAMKLTKNPIPLPYSDCLLLASDLKTISPVTYLDGGSLRSAVKNIDKNNKRLKRSSVNSSLTESRHIFERMRSIWSEKKGTFCSVDFEAWERDHTLITEFGWSFIRFGADRTPSEEQGHLIVEEAAGYRNSAYVVDNRERYNFGSSQTLKKKAFKERIHELFADLKQNQPVFLLFHDNSQDIKYLEQVGVDLTDKTHQLPDSMPENGIYIVDTVDMIAALLGNPDPQDKRPLALNKKSLERTCHLLQIPKKDLHNAGNDAHYTLLAMKAMAEGDPLDMQREKRWPNQTNTGVQVELQPWQEDSDYSDEEGILPPISLQQEKGDTAADA